MDTWTDETTCPQFIVAYICSISGREKWIKQNQAIQVPFRYQSWLHISALFDILLWEKKNLIGIYDYNFDWVIFGWGFNTLSYPHYSSQLLIALETWCHSGFLQHYYLTSPIIILGRKHKYCLIFFLISNSLPKTSCLKIILLLSLILLCTHTK
jgi:hypothetical protein